MSRTHASWPRIGTEANSVIQADCVAPDKCPTQFPGNLNIAASFNRTSFFLKGSVLGTEIRALGNVRSKECFDCPGRMTPPFSAWGPNINIIRDPRFGRTSELASEDPFLSGHYAAGIVHGFQQRDSKGHVKALSYLKHYTMYSDQNQNQPGNVSMHDLHESYLRQYKIAFQQGGASGAMCCYGQINGVRACGNDYILNEVIRKQWGMRDILIGTEYRERLELDWCSSAIHAFWPLVRTAGGRCRPARPCLRRRKRSTRALTLRWAARFGRRI